MEEIQRDIRLGVRFPHRNLIIACLFGVGILITLLEIVKGVDGTLLLTLSYLCGLSQGSIAVVAIAELVSGSWIRPIKRNLLSVFPLIPLSVFLFTIYGFELDIYPWVENQNVWLNKPFFMWRGYFLFLVVLLSALWFIIESLREGKLKKMASVFYLFSFVGFQANIGYDWIMPLDYPWYSSLFDAYVTLEAVLLGMACAGVVRFYLYISGQRHKEWDRIQWDTASIMFGFTFLWGYFLYSQFHIIWYGNLPEEIKYFIVRFENVPLASLFVLILIFIIPWFSLLFRRVKFSPFYMLFLSICYYLGIFIERYVMIHPRAGVNVGVALVEVLLILSVALICMLFRGFEVEIPKEK